MINWPTKPRRPAIYPLAQVVTCPKSPKNSRAHRIAVRRFSDGGMHYICRDCDVFFLDIKVESELEAYRARRARWGLGAQEPI